MLTMPVEIECPRTSSGMADDVRRNWRASVAEGSSRPVGVFTSRRNAGREKYWPVSVLRTTSGRTRDRAAR
jgi:hypothetical protein